VREGRLAPKSLGALAGSDQQLPGMVDADRLQLQQPGRGPSDQSGQPLVGHADLLIELTDAAGDHPQGRLDGLHRIGQGGLLRAQPNAGATNAAVASWSRSSRSGLGAVTSSPLSWLMAAVGP
jgi:hypothetical protein